MPELPDITLYIEALQQRLIGHRLEHITLGNPFLRRTALPPLKRIEGLRLRELRRLGKRIAFGFEQQLWLLLYLMIAAAHRWPRCSSITAS